MLYNNGKLIFIRLIIRAYAIIVFLIQANFILGHFKNFNFKGKLYCKHLIFVASKFGYFKIADTLALFNIGSYSIKYPL